MDTLTPAHDPKFSGPVLKNGSDEVLGQTIGLRVTDESSSGQLEGPTDAGDPDVSVTVRCNRTYMTISLSRGVQREALTVKMGQTMRGSDPQVAISGEMQGQHRLTGQPVFGCETNRCTWVDG